MIDSNVIKREFAQTFNKPRVTTKQPSHKEAVKARKMDRIKEALSNPEPDWTEVWE